MARKVYDPLDVIPEPALIRAKLSETEALAERLRILLPVSERIHAPAPPAAAATASLPKHEVPNG